MKHFILPLMMVMLAVSTSASALSPSEVDAWQQDIRFMQSTLQTKHINLYHSVSEADFNRQIDKLIHALPDLTIEQVDTGIMKILRQVNDAHTAYNIMSGPHRHFPFRFRFFNGELFVIATDDNRLNLRGARLTAINGVPIADVADQVKPYLNFVENTYSEQVALAYHLTIAQFLFGTGVINTTEQASFSFELEGKIKTLQISSVSMHEFTAVADNLVKLTRPLSDKQELHAGLTTGVHKATSTFYIGFAHYPEFGQMLEMCGQLRRQIEKSEARRLIIDFRGNLGGSFYVGLAMSSCLLNIDQFDWQNGIYVMTDAKTQSAAMANTVQFQQILNATVVGTPTGGDPNHYAESDDFRLPNSNRRVSFSKRYYAFSADPTDAVYPDVLLAPDTTAYFAGQDDVLNKLLNKIAKASTSD